MRRIADTLDALERSADFNDDLNNAFNNDYPDFMNSWTLRFDGFAIIQPKIIEPKLVKMIPGTSQLIS